MLNFADDVEPLALHWSAWIAEHPRRPVWLAKLAVSDRADRHVGCYVTPAETVLGLRAWDDADEGLEPAPYALFDIEKLVRMALHQSGLAFEALTSSHATAVDFGAREIAAAAVTQQILAYYRDVSAPLADGDMSTWRWRSFMTGALLGRDGVVSQNMSTLCDLLGASNEVNPADLARLRPLLERGDSLPASPTNYELLNDIVVTARQGHT